MSTHGSVTKAGKVRRQTPKIERTSIRCALGPRLKKRSNYKHFLIDKVVELIRNRDKPTAYDVWETLPRPRPPFEALEIRSRERKNWLK